MQKIEMRAGQLVAFSTGDYSDYKIRGSYVVLKDVTAEMMSKFVAEVKAAEEAAKWGGDLSSMFTARLISEGCLADINLREIHIGNYGELELSSLE